MSTSMGSTSVHREEPHGTRELSLVLLRLLHTLGLSSLSSIKMELEILGTAPIDLVEPAADGRDNKREELDDTWRLDRTPGQMKPRELISGGGRVLRPFTILPSTTNMSDREKLRGEVFRTSHRLPTMTIDEYLAEEERRGNVITGGGWVSVSPKTTCMLIDFSGRLHMTHRPTASCSLWQRRTMGRRRGKKRQSRRG